MTLKRPRDAQSPAFSPAGGRPLSCVSCWSVVLLDGFWNSERNKTIKGPSISNAMRESKWSQEQNAVWHTKQRDALTFCRSFGHIPHICNTYLLHATGVSPEGLPCVCRLKSHSVPSDITLVDWSHTWRLALHLSLVFIFETITFKYWGHTWGTIYWDI